MDFLHRQFAFLSSVCILGTLSGGGWSLGLVAAGGSAVVALAPKSAQAAQFEGSRRNRPRPNRPQFQPQEKRFRPAYVVGGNGVSFHMPLQLSIGGYIPRWRFGLTYERQIEQENWAYLSASALVDRGNWERFGSDACGLVGVTDVCGKGGVAGLEVTAGYLRRFYLAKHPYLVPSFRAGLGFSRWRYPQRNGSRLQARESAWSLDVRAGGGVRWFLTHQLGVGVDLNAKFGWVRHKDRPILANAALSETSHKSDAVFGFEILPLCVDARF